MLVDIIQKIDKSLTSVEFSRILYSLIQSCSGYSTTKIDKHPYNELKPILDEDYTLYFIDSLKDNLYDSEKIIAVLIHLYQYSYMCSIHNNSSIQLQPYVQVKQDKEGRYFLLYETYHVLAKNGNIVNIKDFKYIKDPIEFVERPCIVDSKRYELNLDPLHLLFSHDKCDQYIAFNMMLKGNAGYCSASSTIQLPYLNKPDEFTRSRRTIQQVNKMSKDILSKPYFNGYYYYDNLNTNYKGFYLFEEKLKEKEKKKYGKNTI